MNKDILKQEVNMKHVLIIVGALILFGIYTYIFLIPKYEEYKNIKVELNSAKEEFTTYQEKVTNMPSLEDKLRSTKLELNSKSTKFKHDMNHGMFLIEFDKYRRALGIDLIEYSVGDVIEYENIDAIPVEMNLRGNYKHLRDLLYYLEEQKNMTQVLDYDIQTYVQEIEQEVKEEVKDKKQEDNQGEKKEDKAENSEPKKIIVKKITGEVNAKLKFVMYTDKNPNLELNIDDSGKWTPGKYNPFVPTT
jgi:Tfp pilus assembly protein PilO